MNVQDVMTRNPMTMPVTASVGDVAQAMRDEEVRHVPVMQGATMVGIVSDRDLRSISMPRLVDQAAVESLKSRYDEPISTLMASDPVKVYPTT
ncbi:MAG: CBS domain-containing protein, partial [Myxococcales bacterium]|nr:CBS domain-containing protein [Myxococcales bacterium]